MHASEAILETLGAAIVLGIGAQLLAHRLKLPAILPLLIAGMAFGPHGLHFFDPAGLGAHHLEVLIHLGVAIILFEGGLSLDLRELRSVGGSVRNLLVQGTLVTWLGSAWLAHELVGVAWPTAALFGAIVTVTGPTVIMPLLRHMIAPRGVRTTLLSEGLMIDPIGAVLAYLVLLWIQRSGSGWQPMAQEVTSLAFWGILFGFAAGALARILVQARGTGEELRSLSVLAVLVGCYIVAEWQAPQSGILATMVMGLFMSAARIPDLDPIKAFKGQLTVLIISVLFILLSGRLDLAAVWDLGWPGLATVAGLILIVRPISVLVSAPPKELSWRERILLAMTAPRGIVAAAVASLSAIQLGQTAHADDAGALEGLVYLTILITCTWATIAATLLPRLLGYVGDPSRRRLVLVGSHRLSAALALIFRERGWSTVIVDSSLPKLDELRALRLTTVQGDARNAATYEDAGVERDSHVIAMTPNDELNVLVAELVRTEFGVEHPAIVLQRPHEEFGRRRRTWVDLLGGDRLPLARWNRLLEDEKAVLVTIDMPSDPERITALRALLRAQREDFLPICGWHDDKPVTRLDLGNLKGLEALTLLCQAGVARRRIDEVLRGGPRTEEIAVLTDVADDPVEPTGDDEP